MRILLTGASSFTGMWFAKELAASGHALVMPLLREKKAYHGVRGERVKQLQEYGEVVESCPFGSDAFLNVVKKSSPFDLITHHAAEVTDYKSETFDILAAVEKNTCRLPLVMQALSEGGTCRLLLTGSVFEPKEGAGSGGLPAVSPYGLSKGMTSSFSEFFAQKMGWLFAKFVIPNPFGPYEEERFTAFLMRCWKEGKKASVAFPDYVRDNIHVSLLAKAYVAFAEKVGALSGVQNVKINPSGYVESQGAFTARFAKEMRERLNLPCEYVLEKQQLFQEPKERYNTDSLDPLLLNWRESEAWDLIANYYKER